MRNHLRRMSIRELSEILQKHYLWLQEKTGGVRADLSRCDLRLMNLSKAILVGADLRWSDLSRANLFCANMQFADLRGANLSDSSLKGIDLSFADLGYAKINHSDLSYAMLHHTRLYRVESINSCFDQADLTNAYLTNVNLQGSSLGSTTLRNARLWLVDFEKAVRKGTVFAGARCVGCTY